MNSWNGCGPNKKKTAWTWCTRSDHRTTEMDGWMQRDKHRCWVQNWQRQSEKKSQQRKGALYIKRKFVDPQRQNATRTHSRTRSQPNIRMQYVECNWTSGALRRQYSYWRKADFDIGSKWAHFIQQKNGKWMQKMRNKNGKLHTKPYVSLYIFIFHVYSILLLEYIIEIYCSQCDMKLTYLNVM